MNSWSPRNEVSPGRLVRDFLDLYGLRPRKSLGQHFLVDSGALRRIIAAADLNTADLVVEVGSGPGVLTRELLSHAGSVVAVEKDDRAARALSETYATNPRLRVEACDMLDVNLHTLTGDKPYKVVANLPYYAAAAILRRFLEASHPPIRLVVLLQREVAQSVVAKPGSMSLLSVAIQVYAETRIVSHVKAGSFVPPPKVQSSIVRLDPYPHPHVFPRQDAARFFTIVKAGFSASRKQIANSLAQRLGHERDKITAALDKAHIDAKRRAETLSVNEWGALYRALH